MLWIWQMCQVSIKSLVEGSFLMWVITSNWNVYWLESNKTSTFLAQHQSAYGNYRGILTITGDRIVLVQSSSKQTLQICFLPQSCSNTQTSFDSSLSIFPTTSKFACTRFLIGRIKRYLEISPPANEEEEEAPSACSGHGHSERPAVTHWIGFLAWLLLLMLVLRVLMSAWCCKSLERNLWEDASLQNGMN